MERYDPVTWSNKCFLEKGFCFFKYYTQGTEWFFEVQIRDEFCNESGKSLGDLAALLIFDNCPNVLPTIIH